MVVIVMGLPGSGKSYFASKLAGRLGGEYISSDEVRMKRLSERTYSEEEKEMVYRVMGRMMSEALSLKKPVVLDATFYRDSLRNYFEEKAAGFGEKIIFIEVTAPEHLIEERLQKPRTMSEADHPVYLKLKATYEPLKREHLTLVSSNHNISEMLSEALAYLRSVQ
jgi:predicted kinase